jgi:hypothetical protein
MSTASSAPTWNWSMVSRSAQSAAVCNLDVPVNKTSQAFAKPVAGKSGPGKQSDRSSPPHYKKRSARSCIFSSQNRCKRPGQLYINHTLVSILCKGRASVLRTRAVGLPAGPRPQRDPNQPLRSVEGYTRQVVGLPGTQRPYRYVFDSYAVTERDRLGECYPNSGR